jgi:hypothetical protein
VQTSSFMRVGSFKSPLRVVAGFLLRSRETQARRALEKTRELQEQERINRKQQQIIDKREDELARVRFEIVRLKAENAWLRQRPLELLNDPPLAQHQFGPKMISLCINLARTVGLRPSVACLKIVFASLGVNLKTPAWTTVRTWLMRAGVAAIEEPVEAADDWIWMADHSNQIGPEKVLVLLGIRVSKLPPPGVAIRHQDVRVLSVEPRVGWKRADVARAYNRLAERIGPPLAVLADGAVELREGAEALKKPAGEVLFLGDFKHYAATVMKRAVGGSARFKQFLSCIGRTRSIIQQTELSHFTPPTPKPKARFMNLAATLRWAEMVLWQLDHPDSQARREITAARMTEKLGWLTDFRADVQCWSACQAAVSASITFVNQQGVFAGAAERLDKQLRSLPSCDASQAVADRLLEYLRGYEGKLTPGQRLPLSTEVLESSFGRFKQLERQHSKGGFTSLLAAFGALLQPATPQSIRRDFARVSTKQMRAWVADNLRTTLASKRKTAYVELAHAA